MADRIAKARLLLAALAASTISFPVHADVKAGVDAWAAGDYQAAVREWEGPAAQGDADALFNLAQAYRLGRGARQDNSRAEQYYLQAMQKGHLRAADNYGLMLFQDGRREQALPYVQAAAERGDPRAQYLLGIAHFNGDAVSKDWSRAYALLTLANASGLPQAPSALAQMDKYVPLEQRQAGAALVPQLQKEADAKRAQQLAAADLAGDGAIAAFPAATPRVPSAIEQTPVSPSSAVVPDPAVATHAADGTESPAQAGADFSRPVVPATVVPAHVPAPTSRPPAPAAQTGPWRVQLGAFSVAGNADKLWSQLGGRAELSGRKKIVLTSSTLTKLQAGGFATRDEAAGACAALKRDGHGCLVTK